ncbi:unnamed protein product [Microthlaspi erraticum]|uniref:Uncharacterized protein n=1 Tax=Microthlaspi erraticum TaxID=1685480 RepID=A0A6D2JLI2_9BRAS|nr:unnamed protein product [Microthlaspi erraticum]
MRMKSGKDANFKLWELRLGSCDEGKAILNQSCTLTTCIKLSLGIELLSLANPFPSSIELSWPVELWNSTGWSSRWVELASKAASFFIPACAVKLSPCTMSFLAPHVPVAP